MKKIIVLVLMFVCTGVVSASVEGMTVELKSPEISTNDTTYISVFLLDENQQQITDASPVLRATPSYPVDISSLISCASAEGRDLCAKMDNALVGLGGAYVSEINSKDIDENVILTIYSDNTDDAKVYSRELVIGEGKAVEVQTLEEVPKVGADKIKGSYLLVVLAIILGAFGITLFRFKTQKQEK